MSGKNSNNRILEGKKMYELAFAVSIAVGVSFVCSICEATLYSISWSFIERLRQQGKKSAEVLASLRRNIEKPITSILTLNTIAHTMGAAAAGAAWTKTFGESSLIFFSIVFTIVILLFSEILPKIIGVVFAKQLAPVIARPLQISVWLFGPIIWFGSLMGRLLRGKKGIEPEHTEEDIYALVSLSRRSGILKPYEELSIQNILALDKKTVHEIMTPRIVVMSLPAEATVLEVKESYRVWPHSRIPIFADSDPENIIGMVHRRDVFEALADNKDDMQLSSLVKPVRFVLESLTLDRVLVSFLGSRTHLFVVIDEYGGVAGVVTLEDVLEEILGSEIVDETDQVVDMQELARRRRAETMELAEKMKEKK